MHVSPQHMKRSFWLQAQAHISLSDNAAHHESAAFLASYADAVARQNPFEGHAIAPVRERWRR